MLKQNLTVLLTITATFALLFIPYGNAGEMGDDTNSDNTEVPITETLITPDQMTIHLNDWMQACKAEDSVESQKQETVLFAIINADIGQTQLELQEAAELLDADQLKAGRNPDDKHTTAVSEKLFTHVLSILNTKERLYRSLTDSKDINYKYRLLGDYIQLIRRELKMPKVELAQLSEQEKTKLTK